MFLHETAHTVAAICIGLRIEYIDFLPFGVNLKLKNKIINSFADEMILYFSGPFINILFSVFALVCLRFFKNDYLRYFYINNIALFCMNMLPAMPLDGGIITNKILTYFFGRKTGDKIMKIVTGVISVVVFVLGFCVLYKSGFNFSVLIFGVLLVGNLFTQNEKYDIDFVKSLLQFDRKNKKVNHIIFDENADYIEMAKQFIPRKYSVVYVIGDDGTVRKTLTETQIINNLIGQNGDFFAKNDENLNK